MPISTFDNFSCMALDVLFWECISDDTFDRNFLVHCSTGGKSADLNINDGPIAAYPTNNVFFIYLRVQALCKNPDLT